MISPLSFFSTAIAQAPTATISRRSVDALWGQLEDRKPLVGLGLAP
jgi:hypothetical protein